MWYLILRLWTKTLLELSRASRWFLTVLSTVPFLVIFTITFLQGFNETHHLHEAIYVFSNFILIQFLVKLTVLCGFRVLFSSAAWRQLTWQITKKKWCELLSYIRFSNLESARPGFSSLQKSRRNQRLHVWTESQYGTIFRAGAKAIRYGMNTALLNTSRNIFK